MWFARPGSSNRQLGWRSARSADMRRSPKRRAVGLEYGRVSMHSFSMNIRIEIGGLKFVGRLDSERAPKTCAAFLAHLPFRGKLIQARWSGEAAWMPLGELDFAVSAENSTSDPAPGQLLLYPGGISETEILFPYGICRFASKFGQLAGNHFITIVEGAEQLGGLGERVLWEGAQDIAFEAE